MVQIGLGVMLLIARMIFLDLYLYTNMNIDLDIIKEILSDNDIDLGDDLFAVIPKGQDIILVQGSVNSKLVSLKTYFRYKNLKDLGL
jgi:hypothetical protein